jgi:hypothetical protein
MIMSKLKCWKVDRKNTSWIHKTEREHRGYDSRGNRYPLKTVFLFDGPDGWVVRNCSSFKCPVISPGFKTKREASEFAHEYMKDHDSC